MATTTASTTDSITTPLTVTTALPENPESTLGYYFLYMCVNVC